MAKDLGVTDRTLRGRLLGLGIRTRPGRTAMLSDEDVTKLMEESRERGPSSKTHLPDGATGQRTQGGRELLMDLQDIRRILDGGS